MREKIEELLNESLPCHPSREENLQVRNAIRYLAEEHERIISELSRIRKDRPAPKTVNPYDLSSRKRLSK